MRIFLILLGVCLLCACAAHETAETALPDAASCPAALVVLPDNFVIDLAAGSVVELNPAYQQFALFCTRQEAETALAEDLNSGRLNSAEKWRVYKVHGEFAQLARPCGDGQFCLAIPAILEDWEQ